LKYFLLMTTRTETFNPDHVDGHYQHLNQLKSEGLLEMYGPFGDATGGAYLIKSDSLEEAARIGQADPLIQGGSSTLIVKEWILR